MGPEICDGMIGLNFDTDLRRGLTEIPKHDFSQEGSF